MSDTDMKEHELDPATYAELASIEVALEDVDALVTATQSLLSDAIYKKRAAAIAKIPNFWPLVLEQAPPEIETYIQPSDSQVFAACLTGLDVTRFEMPTNVKPGTGFANGLTRDSVKPYGEPRSFQLTFHFSENEWFTDRKLVKKFWFRRAHDEWAGRVSDPVKINWKKGKDLSEGLTDAAIALWAAQKKAGVLSFQNSEGKEKEMKNFKEYEILKKMVEESSEGALSFFNFFAFRGRWIGAEESVAACKAEDEKRTRIERGEKSEKKEEDDDDDDENLDIPESESEVFDAGEDIALAISEDVWPNAIKYFTEASDADDLSEVDFEDGDEMDEDSDDGEEISLADIKGLVKINKKQKI